MSRRNNNYNNEKVKKWLKRIGIILLAVVACVSCASVAGLFDKELNDENLIDVNSESYIKSYNTALGVKVKVDDDGVIHLWGTATSSNIVNVATVELEAGTYYLSGVEKPDINDFGLRIVLANGTPVLANTDSACFTIENAETVTVQLYWADEYSFDVFDANRTVKPVLAKGDKAVSFFE